MIFVTGNVVARVGAIEAVRAQSLQHVHRSRAEPGCVSHDVHVDVENPCRFVFVERWQDMAALRVHFAVPESGAFVRALATLTSEPPTIDIYEATAVRP